MSIAPSSINDAEIDDLIAELQAEQKPEQTQADPSDDAHLSRIDQETGRKVASAEWTCEDCGAIHHARYFSQDRMLLPPFGCCQRLVNEGFPRKCGGKLFMSKKVLI